MEKLTSKQQIIYEYIKNFIKSNSYPPSIREIAEGVNLSSTATVHAHLKNLQNKGYIKINTSKNRAIELVEDQIENINYISNNIVSVPNLGMITAGNPIEAIETPDEFIDLPSYLVPSNSQVFTLNVKGDSMINIGVFDGDVAIIEKTSNVRNGDHVVAMTPDFEVTLKTFYKEANHYRLQPENDELEPIIVKDVQVLGKLIGLYRQY
ncbi:MAG: transcriptional repressor LexA [Bacilli bacterium]